MMSGTKLLDSGIIRANELLEMLGISRVTLWRWQRTGSFPRSRVLGPNVRGWLRSDVEEWFESTGREASNANPDPK